jgi:hypothetical protein
MLVAYLTIDEVNQDLAAGLAERCNLTLQPLSFRDLPRDGQCDAVVYDLDSLPRPEREEILAQLRQSLTLYPVAVHSYNLEEGQVDRLRQNGVAVYRRLGKAVFLGLKLRRAEVGRLRRAGA